VKKKLDFLPKWLYNIDEDKRETIQPERHDFMIDPILINVDERNAEFQRTGISIDIGKFAEICRNNKLSIDLDNSYIDIEDNIESEKSVVFNRNGFSSFGKICKIISDASKINGLNVIFTGSAESDESPYYFSFRFVDSINPNFECGIVWKDQSNYLNSI